MKTFFVVLLIIICWIISGLIAFYLDVKYISEITETTPIHIANEEFVVCMVFGIISLFMAVVFTIAIIIKNPKEKFIKKFISKINNNRKEFFK